ncbi:cytosine methyltransferase [Sphingomonas sp. Leaf24]|uniref:DNA cytosine methyltransferase n=1 Tax=unclassified Sphingomonas TaxID=196159 RepID=UPI0006F44E2C|nr:MULTISPECIES: DNA cytosine methyltransferase [unclassified Sphingomonas]KQM13240.1 cytosine methyltransferase [Sphingomonas sp. Leaf5]KQM85826.1 cytosine methyltransferase [Sphingomonas sp. Leaf24]
MRQPHSFYEFFAGGGMARSGLGSGWHCTFANDVSQMKAETYRTNWGDAHLVVGDVAALDVDNLPGRADMAWASFPCQDLSLAGNHRGLGNSSSAVMTRSGTFWPFWKLVRELGEERRAPKLVVLENVPGLLTSNEGADFAAICNALADAGYRHGAVVVDADHFVPQSRVRVFFVAVAPDVEFPRTLIAAGPQSTWHPPSLVAAHGRLSGPAGDLWCWWNPVAPAKRNIGFADIIEEHPTGCRWHSAAETARLLAMMTPLHRQKIEIAQRSDVRQVGGVYKRTRVEEGAKRQRAEVRFDDKAGCLRTPAGGSSRQTILVVEGGNIRSRLLSSREAARLMGLPDDYILPSRYNDAYHVAGDGVCVPVVRYLAAQLIEPILDAQFGQSGELAA